MLTYLIEDDPLKSSRIRSYLADKYTDLQIEAYSSFQSGLRAIETRVPQLLLLDMTLPTFDRAPGKREGRIRPLAGYELMRKIKLRGLSPKVVVVSQLEFFGEGSEKTTFAQVTDNCEKEFPDIFVGSVYFRQTSLSWQIDLSKYIEAIIGR